MRLEFPQKRRKAPGQFSLWTLFATTFVVGAGIVAYQHLDLGTYLNPQDENLTARAEVFLYVAICGPLFLFLLFIILKEP